jgi:hypothetical protein
MSYLFRGFFLRASDEIQPLPVIEAVQRHWYNVRIRPVGQPFPGIAVQLADRPPDVFDEDAEELEADLSHWSKLFPQAQLVFIDVECSGGKCLYQGYVCCNSRILMREDTEEEGPKPLRRLLRYIGVELDERGYFAPFERSFFEDQRITISIPAVSMEYHGQPSQM